MKGKQYRLDVVLAVDSDGAEWLELGVYPDRCRAEIMRAAHSNATSGGNPWFHMPLAEIEDERGNIMVTRYRIVEIDA